MNSIFTFSKLITQAITLGFLTCIRQLYAHAWWQNLPPFDKELGYLKSLAAGHTSNCAHSISLWDYFVVRNSYLHFNHLNFSFWRELMKRTIFKLNPSGQFATTRGHFGHFCCCYHELLCCFLRLGMVNRCCLSINSKTWREMWGRSDHL